MKSSTQKSMFSTGIALLCAGLGLFAFASTPTWADPPIRSEIANTISAKATDSFVSGWVSTITYSVTNNHVGILPTIVIQEQSAGALRTVAGGSLISLVIGDWLQFIPGETPSLSGEMPIVTVSKADGTVLSGRISPPESSHFGSVENGRPGEKRTFDIRLLIASDATTGPYTISISGLQVATILPPLNPTDQCALVIPCGDPSSITVTGNSNPQPGGILSAADLADGSNVGARPTRQSFTVANVGAICESSFPLSVITSGPLSAQTVTGYFAPPGMVVDKPGSVFIFGYIPDHVAVAPNTLWTFDRNRNWHLFTGCDTATPYYSGSVARLANIPIIAEPTDLTALIGSGLYGGYGLSDTLSSSAACDDMMQNFTYSMGLYLHGRPACPPL